MAVRPTVLGHTVPDGYRLACLYFGAGLIDRTGTLDHGFPYKVIDPIPEAVAMEPDLSSVCDQRATEIVTRARLEEKPIQLAWSGGIDSTAACVALLKALGSETDRLQVVYSHESIEEYPAFFEIFIKGKLRDKKVGRIGEAFDPDTLLVTGEHGDQLFGSAKAKELSFDDLAAPWEDAFPRVLGTKLASAERVDTMLRYLEPQFRACPVPLPNLFELLWWVNFSMKWQFVWQRIPAMTTDESAYAAMMASTEHFFRTDAFQRWSMANPDKRIHFGNWSSHKWPLKTYIGDFTHDRAYAEAKEKEPSLRGLVANPREGMGFAIDSHQRFFKQPQDLHLRTAMVAGSVAAYIGIEVDLWDAIESDGE